MVYRRKLKKTSSLQRTGTAGRCLSDEIFGGNKVHMRNQRSSSVMVKKKKKKKDGVVAADDHNLLFMMK